ncbi:glycosyltransferase [Nemorincola caseinilytica]|uniref:Glycosyltransferase n=1 Tax=Nemorincola caseinilytica TaxID=2054315 RepID=A0ABP8NQ41_9BACT
MILIDAVFINKGGGAVLLQYLIDTMLAGPHKDKFFFLLDPRFERPAALTANYEVIPNKISERIKYYKQNKGKYQTLFCFANTPPPVRIKGKAYTYFHNQKLLEAPGKKFRKMFWSQYVKYLYVKLYNRNTDKYIVQTPHMVEMLVDVGLKKDADCLTIPFYDNRKYISGGKPFAERAKDEFVFISNPSPQKNYPNLLNAWEHLLNNGHTPVLHVTIDDTAPAFIERVRQLNERGARIVNHVYLDPRELYFNCPYLIFPSLMESFGLPLIEAAESGMKILASDLPFVYDVVKPSLTFDQGSPTAIADAVLRAMTDPALPMPQVVTKNEINELITLLVA